MNSIITRIRELFTKANVDERIKILDTLNELQFQLRDPIDKVLAMCCPVLQVIVVKIGLDLGLFRKMAAIKRGCSKSAKELAEDVGADSELLERILRYLASTKYIQQIDIDEYAANELTILLTDSKVEATLIYSLDVALPTIEATPNFLRETGYKNPTSSGNCPFQKAFNTELKLLKWLPQHTKQFNAFQVSMSALESTGWTNGFDLFEKEVHALPTQLLSSEAPFLVDVGGGHGHQCTKLVEKFPRLHGRLVLEDLSEAIEEGQSSDGIIRLNQDFFKPQAVRGAKFYYIRQILHDWPDDECIQILELLGDAFGNHSRILIDEFVLPDINACWQAANDDIAMMIMFAGAARTTGRWHSLLTKADLRIEKIHVYDKRQSRAIIVVGRN